VKKIKKLNKNVSTDFQDYVYKEPLNKNYAIKVVILQPNVRK